MQIDSNHLFVDGDLRSSPNFGGVITPRFIVVHYTAGGGLDGSVSALENAGLSAHLLIGRDGKVVQTVPFNRRAFHAGKSQWKGYTSLNNHSIGIEVCNYGWLFQRDDGKFQRPGRFGATPALDASKVIVADHKNGWPRRCGWEIYPDRQLKALTKVCEALLAHYGSLIEIVGHDDISPDRKQDPGPAMPMESLQLLAERRHEDPDTAVTRYEVTARSGLNVRGGPGTNHGVVGVLAFHQQVHGLQREGDWLAVDFEGDGFIDGFVHRAFVRVV